jgi:hypothetical protein
MSDFVELFQSLSLVASRPGIIPARRAPSSAHVWIGCDEKSLPTLIVEAELDEPIPPPIVLRNLRFDPWVECSIEERPGAAVRVVKASVIRLTEDEPDLHVYFLRSVSALLAQLAPRPRVSDLARAIDRLIEVFRSLGQPPAASLQGLWAELLLIRHAAVPASAVQAWHTTRRSLFDFDSGPQAVEVKSSTAAIRRHRFKLAQLQAPQGRRVYVVSVLLVPSTLGRSIQDLWQAIEEHLEDQPGLRTRLAEVIAQSIGVDWRHASDTCFDELAARQSIAVFDAGRLPRVGEQAGPEISDIEFTADLSGCAQIGGQSLAALGGLVENLFGTSITQRA